MDLLFLHPMAGKPKAQKLHGWIKPGASPANRCAFFGGTLQKKMVASLKKQGCVCLSWGPFQNGGFFFWACFGEKKTNEQKMKKGVSSRKIGTPPQKKKSRRRRKSAWPGPEGFSPEMPESLSAYRSFLVQDLEDGSR